MVRRTRHRRSSTANWHSTRRTRCGPKGLSSKARPYAVSALVQPPRMNLRPCRSAGSRRPLSTSKTWLRPRPGMTATKPSGETCPGWVRRRDPAARPSGTAHEGGQFLTSTGIAAREEVLVVVLGTHSRSRVPGHHSVARSDPDEQLAAVEAQDSRLRVLVEVREVLVRVPHAGIVIDDDVTGLQVDDDVRPRHPCGLVEEAQVPAVLGDAQPIGAKARGAGHAAVAHADDIRVALQEGRGGRSPPPWPGWACRRGWSGHRRGRG
jgi:hypothetical protein